MPTGISHSTRARETKTEVIVNRREGRNPQFSPQINLKESVIKGSFAQTGKGQNTRFQYVVVNMKDMRCTVFVPNLVKQQIRSTPQPRASSFKWFVFMYIVGARKGT